MHKAARLSKKFFQLANDSKLTKRHPLSFRTSEFNNGAQRFASDSPGSSNGGSFTKVQTLVSRGSPKKTEKEPEAEPDEEATMEEDAPKEGPFLRRVDWGKVLKEQKPSSRGTFTSSHFRVGPNDVADLLRKYNLGFRETENEVVVKECPFCHPTRGKMDNFYKLQVHRHSGCFICFRCKAQGSFFDLKRRLNPTAPFVESNFESPSTPATTTASSSASAQASPAAAGAASGAQSAVSEGHDAESGSGSVTLGNLVPFAQQCEDNLTHALQDPKSPYRPVADYLTKVRGFTPETLRKYRVGAATFKFLVDPEPLVPAKASAKSKTAATSGAAEAESSKPKVSRGKSTAASQSEEWEERLCATFPWIDSSGHVVRMKIRDVEKKSNMRIVPAGQKNWCFFGSPTVPAGSSEIIITEGEFDCMAVHQATGRAAVSLPNGAASLPLPLLEQLESYRKVYLWMDDDGPGREAASHFSKKIGLGRCHLVTTSHESTEIGDKDANDVLRSKGPDEVRKLLDAAAPQPNTNILTFSNLRDQVYHELANPTKYQGTRIVSLPKLSGVFKGLRAGEFTIFTGPTGSGKTTILSQISLDYCAQGVPTLWGSFEIKNTRLAARMLTQYSRQNISNNIKNFKDWADRFSEMPLYFLKFFGTTDLPSILEAMEYAVYVHDVRHIILDNLQFMLSGQAKSGDRFAIQDEAVHALRHFATTQNCHVTLVVHPRKEEDGQLLGMSSVFGSAKATQEADNVLILQKTPGVSFLEVKKNRFDGETGKISFRFDRNTLRIHEEEKDTSKIEEVTKKLESAPKHHHHHSAKSSSD